MKKSLILYDVTNQEKWEFFEKTSGLSLKNNFNRLVLEEGCCFVFCSATLIAAILSVFFPHFHKKILFFLYVFSFEGLFFMMPEDMIGPFLHHEEKRIPEP